MRIYLIVILVALIAVAAGYAIQRALSNNGKVDFIDDPNSERSLQYGSSVPVSGRPTRQ